MPSRPANANARLVDVVVGELRAHDLDERHQRRRVEEVQPDDALRPPLAAAISVTESADVFVARIASAPQDPFERAEDARA